MPNLARTSKAFTLIELLIVIAIIGILMTIIFASFSQAQKNARDGQRKADLQAVAGVLQRFYSDNSVYPSDDGSGQIRINATCTVITSGSARAWGTDNIQCTSGTLKTYLKQLPKDPIGTNQYCYTSADDQHYILYADLEGWGNFDTTGEGVINQFDGINCGGSSGSPGPYNYRVTTND